MLPLSAATTASWLAGLLFGGFALTAAGGLITLARARRSSYFQLRQRAWRRGWRLLLMSAGLLVAAALMLGFGARGLEILLPPTVPSPF